MNSIDQLTNLLNAHKVHQIRSGTTHRFVDISIVASQGRFFVRQYKFNKNSWYDAFLREPEGEIKGLVPKDLTEINPVVTKAFWKKYNLVYGLMKLGFNTKKHEDSTLELIPTF